MHWDKETNVGKRLANSMIETRSLLDQKNKACCVCNKRELIFS